MITMEQLTKILREGFATTLRVHVPAPAEHIERIARDAANNLAMVLSSEIGEHLDEAHGQRLEHESLHVKLHNAGGRGATLDIMLADVLEQARLSYAARDACRKLVDESEEIIALGEVPSYRSFRDAVADAKATLAAPVRP